MAYLKIYCDFCGQIWDVYSRSKKDNQSKVCPHCGAEIDPQSWWKMVSALDEVQEANRELLTDHEVYHFPLFQFDVVEDQYFSKKKLKSYKNSK